jgi:hypothetical protein
MKLKLLFITSFLLLFVQSSLAEDPRVFNFETDSQRCVFKEYSDSPVQERSSGTCIEVQTFLEQITHCYDKESGRLLSILSTAILTTTCKDRDTGKACGWILPGTGGARMSEGILLRSKLAPTGQESKSTVTTMVFGEGGKWNLVGGFTPSPVPTTGCF